MKVEELQGSLEAHELKMLNRNADKASDEQALQVAPLMARKQKKESELEAHVAQDESDEEPVMLMVTTQDEEFMLENWFLDTGCSNHMTGHKKWISNLDTSRKSKISFADDNTIEAAEIGDIVIKKDGKSVTIIESVLYVPG
ncbi:uncharacterized protein LOC108327291 [Vigna angularis]|uniref:uncharacterized protein LOC108327291 n=1 Tax=Phaseolus angularis TaxID=3914 RepID=UPI000809E8A4|nr:uncharacterized protein LOC108327291 [Vigna angularis]